MTPTDAIRASAYAILEDGLFLFLDPPTGPVGPDPIAYTLLAGGVEFGLRVSQGSARALASRMSGRTADELTGVDAEAAVAESLNMVAGHLSAAVFNAEEIDLGIPTPGGEPRGETLMFAVEGGALELWYAA